MDSAPKVSRGNIYQFDRFILDLNRGLLLGSDKAEIPMRAKSFALLRFLVENAGHLLDRDAIMAAVWPGVIVTDESIAQCIKDVRHALNDEAQRLVKTVIKRGYIFAGKILLPTERAEGDKVCGGSPSVAVLPFDNFSCDPRWDRFCDGLVEDIITSLARHPDLLVIARKSSFAYRGRPMDVREIGEALGANYVVEGSLQADAGRLKVTAQLINAKSGVHIWADRYDREQAGLFAIQDEIVGQVVAALTGFGGSILQAELARVRRKPPASLRAYELYLLAYEQEARLDHEGTLRSIELSKAAIEADPHSSRAWTVLGWALGNAAQSGWMKDVAVARTMQRDAAIKAAELDPGDGLALVGLTALHVREDNLAGARLAAEQALVVGANHADTLAFLAKYSVAVLDRPSDALLLMERSLTLNPHAPAWYYLHHTRAAYFVSVRPRGLRVI